jgi:glycosyltransferase involved in cell wall biosynthesis
MTVLVDISRLISRARYDTPTGIDRFELNYANWAVGRFGRDVRFVANNVMGPRNLPYRFAQSLLADTTGKWNSSHRTDDQALLLQGVVDAIERRATWTGSPRCAPAPALDRRHGLAGAMEALLWTPSSVPPSSLFVHVSHSRLHQPSAYDWLAQRNCKPLFYVHDLIPLLRPEFCRAGEAARHRTRIRTILRLHRLILCNSQATARTLDELAAADGLAQPFTAVLPPGLEDAFLRPEQDAGVRTTQPYFVCLGTIEPRKNHALLLEIWRQLVGRYGSRAPRLVIAGRRGWDNSHVFSLLNDPDVFRGSVIEVAGLNDQSAARLVAGASALLAPSHIEGYGMPVAEALALGTPVIASDIRAHREVTRGRAVLLGTIDGVGWMSAIEAHARCRRRNDLAEQRHWTWSAHFDALHRLLVSAGLVPAAASGATAGMATNTWPARLAGTGACQAT